MYAGSSTVDLCIFCLQSIALPHRSTLCVQDCDNSTDPETAPPKAFEWCSHPWLAVPSTTPRLNWLLSPAAQSSVLTAASADKFYSGSVSVSLLRRGSSYTPKRFKAARDSGPGFFPLALLKVVAMRY